MRRIKVLSLMLAVLLVNYQNPLKAGGEKSFNESDTITAKPISFSPVSASEYIMSLIDFNALWRSEKDTLRLSLTRLIDHFNEPFDSVRSRLLAFPFDSVELIHTIITRNDTLPLRWLSNNEFIIDTVALAREPFITQKTILMKTLEIDTLALSFLADIGDIKSLIDSIIQVKDTLTEMIIDYKYLERQKVHVHRIEGKNVVPPLLPPGSSKSAGFIDDSARIVISDATRVLMANRESPFYIVPGTRMTDSLNVAVETLLAYTYSRDSILVFFSDVDGRETPFWLSAGRDDLLRYWVRNSENDSITIWMGNPSKNAITFVLEEDVSVHRKQIKSADDIPIPARRPDRTLLKLQPLKEMPVFWKYKLATAFSLNQNYLSNWSRGGQSSLSGMLDIRAEAKYINNETKTSWNNNGRLRYGSTRTKEYGYRTNTDIIEFNSQYNRVLTNKLDFSSVFYAKTQVAKGYNYPNDSVVVSKFLNPGTFTIGAGVEYKPFKRTLINFSLLSYKNTFVLDTANIRQATHGVDSYKRARQEMGGQLVIKNSINILDGFNISNSVRLFSNYLHKPQNIDVDWEMSIERQINWFSSVRVNLHVIYDDDIRFPVLDQSGQPVLLPDGSPRNVAKTQLNQFLGLTLSFRL